jgi:hypothetical protein
MNLRQFNDRQLIWLVLSLILVWPIGVITHSYELPTERDLLNRLLADGAANVFEVVAFESLQTTGRSIAATEAELNKLKSEGSLRVMSPATFNRVDEVEEELRKLAPGQVVNLDPAKIEHLRRNVSQQHNLDVTILIGLGFLSWLLLSALTYLLGWLVSRIIAGIKKTRN